MLYQSKVDNKTQDNANISPSIRDVHHLCLLSKYLAPLDWL